MTQTAVHLRCNQTGKIRRENRQGRETIVLPSYAAKADTVLNDVLYPREELDKAILGLDRSPAPLGHPTLNGKFLSAMDPEALARHYVFAWNENPRWDGDRIALDVVIDEERAGQSNEGKRLLDAINGDKPLSTSTGLFAIMGEPISNTHKRVATDIVWDHVAILLDEAPAIGPDQGVGIMVNHKTGEQIEVINSTLELQIDEQLDWAIDSVVRAVAQKQQLPLLERLKSSILSLIRGEDTGPTPAINTEQDDMSVTEEQFEALESKVDGLVSGIGETIANAIKDAIAPLATQTEALTNAAKAAEEAELDGLRAQIVNANLMPEDAAKELTLNAARALAAQAAPKKAFGLFNGVATEDDAPTYDLPE